MKITLSLTEAEIKEALLEYAKARKGIAFKSVSLHYTDNRGDPRETSCFSANVSE